MTTVSRQLIAGRYVCDSRIGAGTYAEVFRATDTQTGEQVAVKTLRSEHATQEQSISLFEREGTTGSAISHPNVVKISSFGEHNGTHFIIMELVKGISLRRRLKIAGPLSIAESLRISIGVLRGLEAIHGAGYIHRDIKPQNILIDATGTPKITDFGITLRLGELKSPAFGLAMGTAAYIAPEQAEGQEIGPQADLYSAGAVLFQMLTGEAPFPGDDPLEVMSRHRLEPPRDPRSFNREISPALSAIVLRALSKQPSERFSSAQRMREALEMLQEKIRNQEPSRRLQSRGRQSWTAPRATRRLRLKLGTVPILATVVSALLLVVLIIVVLLALVSSAVDASSSGGQISNSDRPSGYVGVPTPSDGSPQFSVSADIAANDNTKGFGSAAANSPATAALQVGFTESAVLASPRGPEHAANRNNQTSNSIPVKSNAGKASDLRISWCVVEPRDQSGRSGVTSNK